MLNNSIKKAFAGVLSCFLLVSALSGCAGSAVKTQLDSSIETIISDKDHPLAAAAIGIVKDGKILYANTVGTARFDTGAKANADTKYRIASVSKLMTAIGIMSSPCRPAASGWMRSGPSHRKVRDRPTGTDRFHRHGADWLSGVSGPSESEFPGGDCQAAGLRCLCQNPDRR